MLLNGKRKRGDDMDEAIEEEDESMDAGGGVLFMTFVFIQRLMNC